jgi:two-component system, OmpR family, alkaline phosphatase synthesis response regulator PhoP
MGRKKILIVDDEEDVRIFLSYNLIREGYEVHTAENGLMGLNAVKNQDFNLVIADIMMPVLNGIGMFREIKKLPEKNVPVIFLSAANDEHFYLSAQMAGCADFLAKPVSLKRLKEKVVQLIYPARFDS